MEKNFIDFFGGLKTISNFVGELKRSFFLVTPFISLIPCFIYSTCNYNASFYVLLYILDTYIMYAHVHLLKES